VAGWLDRIGLGGERVRMFNLSSAMAVQFAEAVEAMVEKVRQLGLNPLRQERDAEQEKSNGGRDDRR